MAPQSDPAWVQWAARAAAERKAILDAYRAAVTASLVHKFEPKIDKKVYKGCAPFVNAVFHKHCAYCESPVQPAQTYIDVEHYRPKLGIVPFKFKAGRVHKKFDPLLQAYVDDKRGHAHTGYFWLAYDIENLLPSCLACNRYAKKSLFPVPDVPNGPSPRLQVGQTTHAPEQRMLVNPYLDDPNHHFAFDDPKGIVRPLSMEGLVSISVYNLNREGLPSARRDAIDLAVSDFKAWFAALLNEDESTVRSKEERLNEFLMATRPYSTAARTHIGMLEDKLGKRDFKYPRQWGIPPSNLVSTLQ